MTVLVGQIFAAFGAGLLSSLSPCVYPMIPMSVGFLGSQSGPRKKFAVLLFFIGQVFTFTALGMLAVQLGEVFGFSNELPWVNRIIGLILIAFGIASFLNYMPNFFNRMNDANKLARLTSRSWIVPLIIGAGSALLASPCTSPILGTVLATLSQAGTFETGIFLMISYSLGMSILFLALGLGLVALEKIPRAGQWMNHVHRLSSVLILVAGTYFFVNSIL